MDCKPSESILERTVLGLFLLNSIDVSKSRLTCEHFKTERHKAIFMAMSELDKDGKKISCRSVVLVLSKHGKRAYSKYVTHLRNNKYSLKYAQPKNRCSCF